MSKTKKLHPCPDVPTGCACRCHAIGLARSAQKATRRDAWTKAHDEALLKLASDGVPADEMADRLSDRFGVPRTTLSVRRRLKHLDVSRRDGWWSRTDTIGLLGTTQRALADAERRGLLPAAEFGRWRRYRTADIETYVRKAAGNGIDPRRVRDPRLRALAEVSASANARAGA